MSSILIAGMSKTGTTGVYSMIKAAVADGAADYAYLFEPTQPEVFRALGRYAPFRPILAKVMVYRLAALQLRYADFDKRIMTVRDPRDVAVSRLLFRPLIRSAVADVPPRDLAAFIDALREKEADPSTHSVKGLHDLADDLGISRARWDGVVLNMERQSAFIDDHNFFVVRYEDFVDDRLDGLSEYLGFPVANPTARDVGWLSHIPRSMGYGDWKNWFLPEDVEYFGSMFGPFMKRFDYTDSELPSDQKVEAATASEYIERQLGDRREQVEVRYTAGWSADRLDRPEQREHLRSMASDGDTESAHRLALVLDHGGAFERDPAAAEHWAREAAVRGSTGAMPLLARLLRARAADDSRALLEARFWEREVDAAAAARREARRHKRRNTESSLLRSSVRYRLGSLIVEAVSDPVHRGWPALVAIARLAATRRSGRARGARGKGRDGRPAPSAAR